MIGWDIVRVGLTGDTGFCRRMGRAGEGGTRVVDAGGGEGRGWFNRDGDTSVPPGMTTLAICGFMEGFGGVAGADASVITDGIAPADGERVIRDAGIVPVNRTKKD